MVTFLTTRGHEYTFATVNSGNRRSSLEVKTYEWLFDQRSVPGGTYVFSDIERLSGLELSHAAAAASALREAGHLVLNDPARVRCRADLLAALHEAGINRFRAYPAGGAPRPERFPVLLKHEIHHKQPDADLYHDQAALDARLEAMRREGTALREVLVIEFCAEPVRPGIYRKFSMFRVGDRFLPVPAATEDVWAVKEGKRGLTTPDEVEASIRELAENPHEALMRRVFGIASIDYGRSDFGILKDGVAVYEINTNPAIPGFFKAEFSGKRYEDARNAAQRAVRTAVKRLPQSDGPPVRMPWAGEIRLRLGIGYRIQMERP